MTNIVEVSEEDIKNGYPCHCTHCPIALALKRKFNTDDVEVSLYYIAIGNKTYKTNQKMKDFITAYDNNELALPFNFDLDSLEERISIF